MSRSGGGCIVPPLHKARSGTATVAATGKGAARLAHCLPEGALPLVQGFSSTACLTEDRFELCGGSSAFSWATNPAPLNVCSESRHVSACAVVVPLDRRGSTRLLGIWRSGRDSRRECGGCAPSAD